MTIQERLWRRYYRLRNVAGGIVHVLVDQLLWVDKKRTGR